MTRVTTEDIDVTGRSTGFVARVNLDVEDGVVRFPQGRRVEVDVAIEPLETAADGQNSLPQRDSP